MAGNGRMLGVDNAGARYRSSGLFSMDDQYLARLGNRWNNSTGFPPWTPVNLQTGGNWATMQSQLQNMIATASGPCGDGVTTPSGTYPGSAAFQGGVLLPDGRVFCVPYTSTSARIYDPVTDTLTTPAGTYPGSVAFRGGVLLPDGRVFCVPCYSTSARIAGADRGPIEFNMTTSPFFNKF